MKNKLSQRHKILEVSQITINKDIILLSESTNNSKGNMKKTT